MPYLLLFMYTPQFLHECSVFMLFESFRISCFNFRCLKTVTVLHGKAFRTSPSQRIVLTETLGNFTECLLCSLRAEQHRINLSALKTDISHPRLFCL